MSHFDSSHDDELNFYRFCSGKKKTNKNVKYEPLAGGLTQRVGGGTSHHKSPTLLLSELTRGVPRRD